MKLEQLHEARQDQVMKLVQRELWPIAKRLERTLKSGQVVTMRDKDGSVLRDSQEKAKEIVRHYKGDNASQHMRAIDNAADYRDVQKILTNVLLKSTGDAVVKPGQV